jgi:lipocalin
MRLRAVLPFLLAASPSGGGAPAAATPAREVLNSCVRTDGAVATLEGRARSAAPGSTSRLKVSFVDTGDAWDFTDAGTYWVIGLDRDYQWAVVGAPDRSSGFVPARTARPSTTQGKTTSPRPENSGKRDLGLKFKPARWCYLGLVVG